MAKNNIASIICMIMIYTLIIILIPLFMDYLFRITVRRKRKATILKLAEEKAKETKKPLLIFNSKSNAIISDKGNLTDKEEIHGDITELISNLKDNSFVVVVSETLEYVDDIKTTLEELVRISGSDLYIINLEKHAPKLLYDANIINIMDQPFYMFSEPQYGNNKQVKWIDVNDVQKKAQKFYSYVFKVIPSEFFIYDPIVKIDKKQI